MRVFTGLGLWRCGTGCLGCCCSGVVVVVGGDGEKREEETTKGKKEILCVCVRAWTAFAREVNRRNHALRLPRCEDARKSLQFPLGPNFQNRSTTHIRIATFSSYYQYTEKHPSTWPTAETPSHSEHTASWPRGARPREPKRPRTRRQQTASKSMYLHGLTP